MDKNKPTLENASASNFSFVSEIDESDHVWGDTKAPVQLIVFNDFECEFCASFQKTLDKIKEVFGDKVVVAYRHFPLRSNTNAYYAALASECAAQQGKFWEMHDRLFVDNTMKKMTFEQYKQDASELDLDIEEFVACYEAEEGKEKIQADIDEAKRIGVTGAPQTFLNGQILPGAYPFEDFTDSSQTQRKGMKTIIEEILAN
jgi:protein-disulfide isomerase